MKKLLSIFLTILVASVNFGFAADGISFDPTKRELALSRLKHQGKSLTVTYPRMPAHSFMNPESSKSNSLKQVPRQSMSSTPAIRS